MKGTIDSWTVSTASGTIHGDDGGRYPFAQADVVEADKPVPGSDVVFTPTLEDGALRATGVRVVVPAASASIGVVVTDIRLPFTSVAWLVVQVAIVSFLVSLVGLAFLAVLR